MAEQVVITYQMLLHVAESILEVHVAWCGSPLNPLYPHHNPACRSSAERVNQETTT